MLVVPKHPVVMVAEQPAVVVMEVSPRHLLPAVVAATPCPAGLRGPCHESRN